jgi:MFS family permease
VAVAALKISSDTPRTNGKRRGTGLEDQLRVHTSRSLLRRYPALRSRNFVMLWSGLIVSNAGTQMQGVAQNWLLLDLWHSPLALGVNSLAGALPMIVLPYVGGAVADRVDRVTILKITQTGQMACAGVLTVLAALGLVQVWQIVGLTVVSASLLAFDNPTRQALFPDLVPRADLMNAISLQSAAFTGAALFGPALGGVLLVTIHPTGVFLLNTMSFLAVLAALLSLRGLPAHVPAPGRALRPWLAEGLAYAWHTPVVRALLALSFAGNLLGRSYVPLLAVFARSVFHVGAGGYGLMVAATGLGALGGAIGLAGSGDVRAKGRLALYGALGFWMALVLFALGPPYGVGLVLLMAAGVTSTLFSASIATMLQLRVPRALRGRVMSLYTITLIGISSLGALGSAAVATATTPEAAYVGGATLFAVCALAAAPRLWVLHRTEAAEGASSA